MPDGSPQITQTWVDTDGTNILINTVEGYRKVKNIRRNPRVAVAVADPRNPARYYSVRGKVTGISAAGASEHIEQLSQLYFGKPFPWVSGHDQARVIVAITADQINAVDPS